MSEWWEMESPPPCVSPSPKGGRCQRHAAGNPHDQCGAPADVLLTFGPDGECPLLLCFNHYDEARDDDDAEREAAEKRKRRFRR